MKREQVSEEEDTGKGGRKNRWVKKIIQKKGRKREQVRK